MKNILEDLYFGDICPNLQDYKDNPQYSEAMNVINSVEEKLTALLDGKEKKMFLDFVNAYDEVAGIISSNSFIEGFKLGGNIIIQIISE